MFYNFKIKNYLIFLIILCSCNFQENDEKSNLTNAIPINSNVIIKFHNIHKMKEKLDSFKWWGQLKDVDFIDNVPPLDVAQDVRVIGRAPGSGAEGFSVGRGLRLRSARDARTGVGRRW